MVSAQQPGIKAGGAWMRIAPFHSPSMIAYLQINNSGHIRDVLLSASSPQFEKVWVQQNVTIDGLTRMMSRSAVSIEPGKTVSFAPGGIHLMMMKPQEPLQEGQQILIELFFERARWVRVWATVVDMNAKKPATDNKSF